MQNFKIKSKNDLINAIEKYGFLPLFANDIRGFSVEEHTAPELWFTDREGPWEWKGPVIRETGCAYGKFFDKKAAFISREMFPDFANYRRDGYDFDARYDEGFASYNDKKLYDLTAENAPVISKKLKQEGNYKKGGNKGFETIITRLQAQCYILISDFIYLTDKNGNKYGWGVAEYSTPEVFMGEDFCSRVYSREPEESYNILLEHFKKILPKATEEQIIKLLK